MYTFTYISDVCEKADNIIVNNHF